MSMIVVNVNVYFLLNFTCLLSKEFSLCILGCSLIPPSGSLYRVEINHMNCAAGSLLGLYEM